MRAIRSPRRQVPLEVIAALLIVNVDILLLRPTPAGAGCNLIPAAARTFPSEQGAVASVITAPGEPVEISLTPCDGGASFDPNPMSNEVTLRFEPPAGSTTDVLISGVSVSHCVGGVCSACSPGACNTLSFLTPDTDAILAPAGDGLGLTGPAHVIVEVAGDVVADVSTLYQPTLTCDREPETVFTQFTVLPPPNQVETLCPPQPGTACTGTATRVLATVDGDGNLLVPLDHTVVLPLGPAAPVARLESGATTLPAFPMLPGTIRDTLAAIVGTPDEPPGLIRSFTLQGRPLPPLLRIDASGGIFGASDALASVLRLTRQDANGTPLYDVTTRLHDDRGPIVIAGDFSFGLESPMPLAGLRPSDDAIAYVRDETLASESDLNGDGDENDQVVQLIDIPAGSAVNTGRAVAAADNGPFTAPAMVIADQTVAFLESEPAQGPPSANGDGDTDDAILRVYDSTGTAFTSLTPGDGIVASTGLAVNGRPLAIADSLVYARSPAVALSLTSTAAAPSGGYAAAAALSPDGLHMYVVHENLDAISVFSRNGVSGALTFVGHEFAMLSMGRIGDIVVSPDGAHVYVVGGFANGGAYDSGTITTFGRNAITGDLTWLDRLGSESNSSLPHPYDIEISPDGKHLYFAGGSLGLQVLARNSSTGILSEVADLPEFGAEVVRVSPDGAHVYAALSQIDALARDAGTGMLTFIAAAGAPGTWHMDLAVSADGKNVYVAGSDTATLGVFARDLGTGVLTYVDTEQEGVSGVRGFGRPASQTIGSVDGPHAVAIDPGGDLVYVVAGEGGSLATFVRDALTGHLTFLDAAFDGVDGVDHMGGPRGLVVSANGVHVYVPAVDDDDVYVNVFTSTVEPDFSKLAVFDTGNGTLRPVGAVAANAVEVSGDRALVLTPEAVGGDLNGDGDTLDDVPQLYDSTDDTVVSLGRAATRIALTGDLAAVTIRESAEGPAPGTDLNDDGDMQDDVLFFWRVGDPVPIPLANTRGDVASGPSFSIVEDVPTTAGPADLLVFVSPQVTSITGEDAAGLTVVRVDPPPATTLVSTNLATISFTVQGHLVAFLVSEFQEYFTDLNGDDDYGDDVMHVLDLDCDDPTGATCYEVVNTGQAGQLCGIPGCDPLTPFKVTAESVAFLTSESAQSADLNKDGDTADIVLQVFTLASRRQQVFDPSALTSTTVQNAGTLSPFPTELFGGPLITIEASEPVAGRDLNGDGDMLDEPVVLLVGDQDDDGTFDDFDHCTEEADAAQHDSDRDGLGNQCDPTPFCSAFTPPAPALVPLAGVPCQKALGKAARSFVQKRAKAVGACLDGFAKGARAGDPSAECRGVVSEGGSILPRDAKTAEAIAKALDKLAAHVANKCSDVESGLIEACTTAAADLPRCLAIAYGALVQDASQLAYGDVRPSATDAERKCQLTIGKESAKYVGSIVKAMHGCLDRFEAGKLAGDPQAACLGAMTPAGITLPTDPAAGKAVAKAEAKLRAALDGKCAGSVVATLDVCGGTASTGAEAATCLVCTQWRGAIESLQSAYGPD